jgi:hypothetical protein
MIAPVMRMWRFSAVVAAAAIAGCATTDPAPAPTATDSVITPDCRVARVTGDVAALRRSSGEIVIVVSGLELLRSTDDGASWRREALSAACSWPDIAEVGGRLVVSCSEPKPPSRLLVLLESPSGDWGRPIVVDTTDELLIDTHLQTVGRDEVLLFATHIDRPEDLDDAVYTLRSYRSVDACTSWTGCGTVTTGARGRHLEDTRTVRLDDGTLLLAYEREKAEGARSSVRQMRSADDGRSWDRPTTLWRGGDVEPGGYILFPDGELWFIASSDRTAGGGSYDRATILARRSVDGGRGWSSPETLVDREDQISFGGVVLPGDAVLLPSLRHYTRGKDRRLAIYRVDRDGASPARCAGPTENPPEIQPSQPKSR